MSRSRSRSSTDHTPESEVPAPRLRRAYFECRYGQLHVHNAFPGGGGFDEGTPLLCLHQSPMSGRVFGPLMQRLGRLRSVYAPDTPGFGQSDAPPERPRIVDYAAAMIDFIDSMRLRAVDLLGYHTGSVIATEVAIARPQVVRRLVLIAIPVLTAEERAAFARSPWPVPIAEDGSHLLQEWQRSLYWRGPGVTVDQLARGFAEKLHNGPNAWWGASAVMQYAAVERLPMISQPVLVLRPHDDLWDATARARGLLRNARFVDLPDYGHGLLEVAPEAVEDAIGDFLAA
jgi:pimeloyl-ACP methyl ester carboxylesterase